jgi:FkbM family methyltransferase
MTFDEGAKVHYYLHYGNLESTLTIQDTLARFNASKTVTFTIKPLDGDVQHLPKQSSPEIGQQNLALINYLHRLDYFLAIAPDCLILRHQWAIPFLQAIATSRQPILGHLKTEAIGSQTLPTHVSRCALYNGAMLRALPLEAMAEQGMENPWLALSDRDALSLKSVAAEVLRANRFTIDQIPYDYLLFALYFRELTGANNPLHWPLDSLENRDDLIISGDRPNLTINTILEQYFNTVSVMYGVQDDGARQVVLRRIKSQGWGDRQLFPLGGRFNVSAIDRQRPVNTSPEAYLSLSQLRPDNSGLVSIHDLQGQFGGKRCFIIGNGPSLKKTDLSRLKNEFTVGLNRIYLNYPNMGFEPTFYCCVNSNVLSQFADEIDRLNSIKFVKKQSSNRLKNHWNTFFMQSDGSIRFHENLNRLTWHEGWTVTYCAMQVAFHLGFDEVILVGVDHYFKDSGEANKAVTATGDDANHFHPDYFGKGVVWQYPDLDRSEESYRVAKQTYEKYGRRILDATIGGHLQIFPKVDFNQITTATSKSVADSPSISATITAVDNQSKNQPSAVHQSGEPTHELRFSIITPSFNQAAYIQRHLDSIKHQTLKPFEHLIYDPGSTDGSLELIERYCNQVKFAQLINEADDGQVDALNKGFARATGDIVAWLNSDDYYFNHTVLEQIASVFRDRPNVDVVYGRGLFVNPNGETIRDAYIQHDDQNLKVAFQHSVGILQPALFFRRNVLDTVGLLNTKYNFAFDYDYWIRIALAGKIFFFLDHILACAVLHDDSKTCSGRGQQYDESLAAVKSHYRYVPIQWIDRYAEYLSDGMDGIVISSSNTDVKHTDRKQLYVARLLKEWDTDADALSEIIKYRTNYPYRETLKALRHHHLFQTNRIVVTSFNSDYFNQGLNLIAGLHRTSYQSVDQIFIYDLGLTQFEKEYLRLFEKVFVLDYPKEVKGFFDGYLAPKNYSYKCAAIAHSATLVAPDQLILWVDAGVTPIRDIKEVFDQIESDEIFFIDHDDTSFWPFYNINFTHPEALTRMNATVDEALGFHLCSAMVGYKRDGAYQSLINEAYQLSQIREIVCWPKHLKHAEQNGKITNQSNQDIYSQVLTQLASSRAEFSLPELCDRFPYLGHRQDQSIYSILAARYHCKIQSARSFCRSNSKSSWASKKNWESGGESPEIQKTVDNLDGIDETAATFHHRGIFNYLSGLRLASARGSKIFVLGNNGESTQDFDPRIELDGFDSIGMNAAYQHWDDIDWYPTYYVCMDETLTESHASEIKRLIQNQHENGIRLFFLRQTFIEIYPQFRGYPTVFVLEEQTQNFPVIDFEPITTGSFAALFAALLGYTQIYLLGIDCNYAEQGDAEHHTRDLHLQAWSALKKRLFYWDISIKNCNLQSILSIFPRVDLASAKSEVFQSQPRSITQLVNSWANLAGGYDREAHAHYDETMVVYELLSDLPQDAVMIDVGAHFGTALHPFAKKGWRVLAFEPDPDNRQKLEQRATQYAHITIDIHAVSDRPGEILPLYGSDESTGISALAPFRDSHAQKCEVRTTTIEQICADYQLDHVDFLKIDTEGYDLMVLKGVPWEQLHPRVIECEFEDRKTIPLGYTFDTLAQYLVERGYTVLISEWHPVIRYGIQHDWYRLVMYPCQLADPNAWGNILAFRDSPDLNQVAATVRRLVKTQSPDPLTSDHSKISSYAIREGHNGMNSAQVDNPSTLTSSDQNGSQSGKALEHFTTTPNSHHADTPIAASEPSPPRLAAGLLKRIGHYYSRWPLGIAVLAVSLNTAAVFDTPYRWAFAGTGNALVMFLVGHAASKADFALGVGDRAQVSVNQAEANANQIRTESTLAVTKANQALNKAKQSLEQSKTSFMLANRTKGTAEFAMDMAKRSRDAAKTAQEAAQSAQTLANRVADEFRPVNQEVQRLKKSVRGNSSLFQPFERRLSQESLTTFLEFWIPTLSLDLDQQAIGYLAHRICLCEDTCSGRLATNVQDMLLRILIARSVSSRDLSVLEIGSLFGINLAILYETCRNYFETIHLTAIDPLDGYYGQSRTDLITKVPITRDIFEHNLRKVDVPLDDVTLLQGLSTDNKVLANAGLRQYNLLVIDGDHTYDGVKFDFDHYLAAVDVGGYIIFDDYSTEHWPEVAEFVDQEVKTNPYVEFVGSSWRTGVFRVIRKQLG